MTDNAASTAEAAPTVSVYQNADHVAGLVQQIFEAPLVVDETRENTGDTSKGTELGGTVDLHLEAQAAIPLMGRAKAGGDAAGNILRSQAVTTASRTTQSFVYSQAYYLRTVRAALRASGALRILSQESDADTLATGDIVEFSATFASSEIAALMDVLTPELVAEIASSSVIRQVAATHDDYDSYEEFQRAILAGKTRAEAQRTLAGNITRAVQADFRRDKTREYLGSIQLGHACITAVTICDNQHFVVADEDRMLDGEFTVLGKVISALEENVPVLRRNKLLRHVSPSGADSALSALRALLQSNTDPLPGLGITAGELIDMRLESRIAGRSFRVIPIAIFA